MKLQSGIKRINELIESIKGTDIEEIYFEKDGLNIGIKKDSAPDAKSGEAEQAKEASSTHSASHIVDVISHSVGLFRDSIPSSKKVGLKVGQSINKGQKLCFIESMKIMKEVVSPVKGEIAEKLVKNGDPVEYGQILFKINVV